MAAGRQAFNGAGKSLPRQLPVAVFVALGGGDRDRLGRPQSRRLHIL